MKPATGYRPTPRLFLLLGGLVVLGVGFFIADVSGWLWGLVFLAALVMGGSEALKLRQSKLNILSSDRTHQPTLEKPFQLVQVFHVQAPAGVRYTLKAIETDVIHTENPTGTLTTLPDGRIQVIWDMVPSERGDLIWPGAYIFWKTGFGLLEKWRRIEQVAIAVYPRLLTQTQEQLNPNLLIEQMGVKINRYRKAEQDFESLRPYVQGDNYRHIDWKASSRMGHLISRQFHLEHHHNILVCLDISRLMGTVTEGVSKLDWSIEAALHLAYLASRLEDRIGLLVFSNDVHHWVKPMQHPVEAFLKEVYNLNSRVVEADFQKVCMAVMTAQKKRSLVIFLSDFLDPASLEPSIPAFGQLNRKHCSLFIGIEDPAYKRHLNKRDIRSPLDLTQTLVAQDSMQRRQLALQQLRQVGLRAITVTPENLVQQAMDAYLQIKFEGGI